MTFLKIPFGLRDGAIVMIGDITPEERGSKCNCVCPSCRTLLLARLGDIRTHHFAHSVEGCDEQIAFLSGLYQMVKEYVLNNEIVLPKLEVFWSNSRSKFTPENFFDRIRFTPTHGFEKRNVISEGRGVKFENAKIVCTGKTPTALILEVKSRQMALCIRPPSNVCKQFFVKPYKDLSTLELNSSKIPFGELNREQIMNALRKCFDYSRWIYNSKALRAIENINKENDAWIEEIRKREEEEKHRREEQRILQLQCQQKLHQRSHDSDQSFEHPHQLPSLTEEEKRQAGYEEVKDLVTQQETQIIDSFGQRWIQCKSCGEIKLASECVSYGGKRTVNLGLCKECSHKGLG